MRLRSLATIVASSSYVVIGADGSGRVRPLWCVLELLFLHGEGMVLLSLLHVERFTLIRVDDLVSFFFSFSDS